MHFIWKNQSVIVKDFYICWSPRCTWLSKRLVFQGPGLRRSYLWNVLIPSYWKYTLVPPTPPVVGWDSCYSFRTLNYKFYDRKIWFLTVLTSLFPSHPCQIRSPRTSLGWSGDGRDPFRSQMSDSTSVSFRDVQSDTQDNCSTTKVTLTLLYEPVDSGMLASLKHGSGSKSLYYYYTRKITPGMTRLLEYDSKRLMILL